MMVLAIGLAAAASACGVRPPLDSGAAGGAAGTQPGLGGATGIEPGDSPGAGSVDAGRPMSTPAADAGPAPGGPRSCVQLEADYVAAVEAAKACDPTSSVPQCTLFVIPALCVGGCSTLVNDTSGPTAVRLAWDAIPCPVHPTCPPSVTTASCPGGRAARCLAQADGTGRCVAVAP
jgi:hypothetical protein